MAELVEIVSYRPEWPQLFEAESKQLRIALGANCLAIHHVGSTAVPGLCAKPIIDMVAVVKNILLVDQVIPEMQKLGYECKGEYGMPFRRYFQKGVTNRTHNVHIFEEGNPEIERHLKFRDWMRTHGDDREAYGRLKAELASKFPNDIMNYCLGKDAFVAAIDEKIGFDGFRIVQALTGREWEAARHFRQKYFFDRVPIADPYTWTFKDKRHVHFVLYKGSRIIGYAHIQLWPESRAAMRIIVIDEPYRNQGLGSQFLKMCERWLMHQSVEKLQVQSSPEAYRYYCNNAYVEMPFNDPDGHEGDLRDVEMGKIL